VLSFVIPAYNEEKYLAPTLAAIHEAARAVGEPYEIVVADDSSTDRTAEIAQAAGARVERVEKRKISAVRNAGARVAQGDVLIFVDADTRISAAVVSAALEALRNGAVGGGAGVDMDEHAPAWTHRVMFFLLPFFYLMKWAAGCFLFCRRDAFEAAGGFDETYFAAEEIHMSQALKRHGRFVVLRERVVTSSRKAEGRSALSMLWLMVTLVARSPLGVKDRKHAAFWYDVRR
jgi:glycosyltransferase involved in cell wall biosynthesis